VSRSRGLEHPVVVRPLALSLVLAAMAIAGCTHGYQPPPADAPHALVRVRVRHLAVLGAHLVERVMLNGERVRFPRGATSTVLRVRPGRHELGVHAAYHEEALRPTIVVQDETRTSRCRFRGDDGRTDSGWCTTTEAVATPAIAIDRLDAGGCATSATFHAREGARYVLEYELAGANACRITCARIDRTSDGGTTRTACGRSRRSTVIDEGDPIASTIGR